MKRIFCVLIATLLFVMIAGCEPISDDVEEPTTNSELGNSENVVITSTEEASEEKTDETEAEQEEIQNIKQPNELLKYMDQAAVVDEENIFDETQEHLSIDMTYPVVQLKDNQAMSDAINQQIKQEIDERIEWMKERTEQDFSNEETNVEFPDYGAGSEFRVAENNQEILSILITYWEYAGGAHGMYYSVPYNYNAVTGEEIKFTDFFVDGYDYNQKIIDEVTRQIETQDLKEVYYPDGLKDYSIYYEDGLVGVIYAPYVIGPYAAGEPTFYIPFSYFEDGLK